MVMPSSTATRRMPHCRRASHQSSADGPLSGGVPGSAEGEGTHEGQRYGAVPTRPEPFSHASARRGGRAARTEACRRADYPGRVTQTPPPPATTDHQPVLVVDFGAQYAQLIARRVREANVYSEIVPHTASVADLLAKNPAAIILSGGPSSVYATGAPFVDPALFEAGVPVLGICYGFQAMAAALGGTVAQTGQREYGGTAVEVTDAGHGPGAAAPTARPSG